MFAIFESAPPKPTQTTMPSGIVTVHLTFAQVKHGFFSSLFLSDRPVWIVRINGLPKAEKAVQGQLTADYFVEQFPHCEIRSNGEIVCSGEDEHGLLAAEFDVPMAYMTVLMNFITAFRDVQGHSYRNTSYGVQHPMHIWTFQLS